jgi:anti-sigma regulatory factor (Ser/Thr protein kinase)
MNAEQGFDLTVEACLDNLQPIRNYIDEAGARIGVTAAALGDLRLVVDEAVTNVVVHGYGGESGGTVEVHMESDGDAVIVTIRDRAPHFDPQDVGAPQLDTALEDRPFGGMGIFLIRQMTDEADFNRLPGGGNEIRLVKRGAIYSGQGQDQ